MKTTATIDNSLQELFSIVNKLISDLKEGNSGKAHIKPENHCENFSYFWDCSEYCFCKENLNSQNIKTLENTQNDLFIKKVLLRIVTNLAHVKMLDFFLQEDDDSFTYSNNQNPELVELRERRKGEMYLNEMLFQYCKTYLVDSYGGITLINKFKLKDQDNVLGLREIF